MTATYDRQLSQLEAARYRFGPRESAPILKLLRALDHSRVFDPAALIRFHEALMFLRAFPQSAAVLQVTERILDTFHKRVQALHKTAVDMEAFGTYETSGIAGTTMEDTLSFDVARWLVRRTPGQVEIAWDNYEPGRELGTTGPRVMPLLQDDADVEADTPFQRWLQTASGKKSATARWLIERFESLPLPDLQKAALYESLRIPLRWNLGNLPISRTRNWKVSKKVFYHQDPLISRSQVSLAEELAKRPPQLRRPSLNEGQAVVEQIREIMLVRYRELYGTTLADPRSVVCVDLGDQKAARGIEIYLWNLPADRRLPLRAYVAGFTLKNGVPINYIEAIGLCEWMEVGFNTFYTFRGGEAGWIYAQVLRSLCHLMGTTVVSVYPYQLGHENDEAIESGAFWFYRKLGFRPGRPDLMKLVQREEAKIAANPKYRTPARTLRRLAAGHVFYDLPGSEVGAWDRFSTRNIGLRVNQRMARDYEGDSTRMRADCVRSLERVLGIRTSSWKPLEKAAFENFALALGDVAEIRGWKDGEKQDLLQVIRAKSKPDEMLYLHRSQKHSKLREVLIKQGSPLAASKK
jgi:hypothetical protein